ncbi:MAG: molybdopterin molybdotransferase MoeA, partial [Pseudomonadota bacterium]
SAMDGYAVRREEAQPGATLKVVGEAAAGHGSQQSLGPGQAIRIFTGAPVPAGADDIVIQEDVERDGVTITIRANRDTASYIRPAGGDFEQGHRLVAPRVLTPGDIALVAGMNFGLVPVRRRPVIALVPTGDELRQPGSELGQDQIISTSSYGLKALFDGLGAETRLLPIAKDTTEALADTLALARDADLIVTLGGASVGDHDLVQEVAQTQGLDLSFYKVAIRPGKPLMAGTLGAAVMIGLPGNPVSAMVCAHIFVRPALSALLGLPTGPLAREVARLTTDLGPNGPREHYMRARLTREGPRLSCEVFERQDSSLTSVFAQANGLAVRPVRDPARKAGDEIEVIWL